MPINQYFQPAEFTPLDPGFLLKVKEANEAKADKANADFESLFANVNKIKAVPQDISLRNQKLSKYNEQLKSWTDKYANNPVLGINELRKIKRDFTQDVTYGQLGDIHNKGLQYEENVKNYNELASKGHFKGLEDVAYYNMVQAPLLGYEQSKEIAPGVYNRINWGQPTEYFDLGEDFDKFAKQWASSEGYGQLTRDKYGYLSSTKNTYVNPQEVINGVMSLAYNNPKYKTQLSHMANYYQTQIDRNTNVTPEGIPFVEGSDAQGNPVWIKPPTGQETVKDYILGIADALGAREGFQKLSKDYMQDWKEKFAWEEAAKQRENQIQKPSEVTYLTPGYEAPSIYWDTKIKAVEGLFDDQLFKPNKRNYTPQEIEELYAPYGGRSAVAKMPGTRAEAIQNRISAKISEGKPISKDEAVKVSIPNQYKGDLEKAAVLFKGRDVNNQPLIPTDYKDQVNLLKQYYKYSRSRQIDMPVTAPKDPQKFVKLSTSYNQMYFGDPAGGKGRGSYLASSQPVVILGGTGEPEAGSTVMEKYGNLNFKYQGDAPVSNATPYAAGRVFVGLDPETNQVKVRILVPASEEEQTQKSIKHSMYQPKHTGNPVRIVLPDKQGNLREFEVDYQRESKQELTNAYMPIEQDRGTAILKDAQGNEVFRFKSGDINPLTNAPEYDAIKGLYESKFVSK